MKLKKSPFRRGKRPKAKEDKKSPLKEGWQPKADGVYFEEAVI